MRDVYRRGDSVRVQVFGRWFTGRVLRADETSAEVKVKELNGIVAVKEYGDGLVRSSANAMPEGFAVDFDRARELHRAATSYGWEAAHSIAAVQYRRMAMLQRQWHPFDESSVNAKEVPL